MNTLTHEYTEKVENLLSSSNLGEKRSDSCRFKKNFQNLIHML